MTDLKITIPDIGDFKDVEIIELLVKEGQSINKNDSLITLESDKSSVEVPSTDAGTIKKIHVKVGDKVNKGDLILSLKSEKKIQIKKEIIAAGKTKEDNNDYHEYDNGYLQTFKCFHGSNEKFDNHIDADPCNDPGKYKSRHIK